jgi:hypothetical protein
MSTATLTQRFLNELDTNSSTERARIAAQLEEFTQAERELGASEAEAQRRAVQKVGSTLATKLAPSVALAPLWQVTLLWIAVELLVFPLLFAILPSWPLAQEGSLVRSTIPSWVTWGIGAMATATATCAAAAWNRRLALRASLQGLALCLIYGVVSYLVALRNFPQLGTAERLLTWGSGVVLSTSLSVAVIVATLRLWGKKRVSGR